MRAFARFLVCFALPATLAATRAAAAAPPPAGGPSPDEKVAADTIRPAELLGAVRFLSDDLLEGRSPGSTGDRLAQRYLATELERLGFAPGAPDGTYVQAFDIVGVRSKSSALTLSRGAEKESLKPWVDYVAFAGTESPTAELAGREIVFVGYGIVAPEYEWDDYKGADLKGKVLLFLNNDPEDDPAIFARKDPPLLRALGLQVRDGREEGRRGRHHHPHDAVGGLSLAGGPDVVERRELLPAVRTERPTFPSRCGSRRRLRGGWRRWPVRTSKRSWRRRRGATSVRSRSASRLTVELRNEVRRTKTANVIGKLPGATRSSRRRPCSSRPTTTTSAGTRTRNRGRTRSTTAPSTTPPGARRSSPSQRRSRLFQPAQEERPRRVRGRRGARASRVVLPRPASPAARRADRREHQRGRGEHLGANARRRRDRSRQVGPRRLHPGDRVVAGPDRHARPLPGSRHVLPVGPVLFRRDRRPRGLPRGRDGRGRPARRMGARAADGLRGEALPPAVGRAAGPTGAPTAGWRTPGSSSGSA